MGYLLKRMLFTVALVVGLVFTFIGCSDDEPTQPQDPNIPTFANIWPAVEGTRMEFDISSQNYSVQDNSYETLEDIPEIPSMEELYVELQAGIGDDFSPVASGVFYVEFLEEFSDVEGTTMLNTTRSTESIEGNPHNPNAVSSGPYFTRTEDRLFTSLEDMVFWVHLDGSLEAGHSFNADITRVSGAHLESRIWQIKSFSSMGNEYPNCVECFYIVDYGVRTITDDMGEVEGYFRWYSYGLAVYAPGVGLVYNKEKAMWYVGAWETREATLRLLEGGGDL